MDWTNINLTDSYERSQNILDPINFDSFLLEISCNIKTEDLTPETIKTEFLNRLKSRVEEAKEIFEDNLKNIVSQAKKERNQK